VKRISNASMYLKALPSLERASLQSQVDQTVADYLMNCLPGEDLAVDDICSTLHFDLAQRQLLNGLLRRLDHAGMGRLILGRKGHKTKFIVWTGDMANVLLAQILEDLPKHSTVREAINDMKPKLELMLVNLEQLLNPSIEAKSYDSCPAPKH
jgi:hypothetical protein